MRILMLVLYIVLIIIGVSFAALNASSVQVNFYFKTLSMPISVLMTIMLGIGIFIGFILFIGRYWRLKIEYRKMKGQLKLTEREIKNLRSIPLQDQH
ncbi:LapA family protein [Legionella maioricensis]|uniref:LapA family protein n=1 Tax=Legionella maioricensis TaxID=2896528 RepID=A0A9X2D0N1_9GAMM|nr:LapA family protein [Legionella maioricensis]MCL9684241.1 LapA family protein [Legionella maioricensis]MCL9687107.1 LapA family protein [Legionella maioricensis]